MSENNIKKMRCYMCKGTGEVEGCDYCDDRDSDNCDESSCLNRMITCPLCDGDQEIDRDKYVALFRKRHDLKKGITVCENCMSVDVIKIFHARDQIAELERRINLFNVAKDHLKSELRKVEKLIKPDPRFYKGENDD